MQDFRISLNSTTNVFFANSEVHGTVYLKTEEPLKARKIEVSIIGRAKAAFNQLRGSISYYYCLSRSYIEIEEILWESDGDTNKIAAGNYQFPFKFVIPINCPPNISATYGNIKYYVQAKIDVPWAFNKNFVAGFSVCPFIDLNIDSRLASPVINYIEKTKLFSSKAVKATVRFWV
uniref:Arrestin-like N-terminal domain-containing protein n=1 Tax=Panagrolaimus superbus TaxID=310955 RepID=A0A914YP96_9BILA